ncbi:MAG: hypothetical protein M1482_07835, partial [Chloroflexi bacterium]|nr:hypothetical protein [Chloroflexota bacterium]
MRITLLSLASFILAIAAIGCAAAAPNSSLQAPVPAMAPPAATAPAQEAGRKLGGGTQSSSADTS